MASPCCRVCGLAQATPPWGESGDAPSHLVCACCGTHFGVHDRYEGLIVGARRRWIEAGFPWLHPEAAPPAWNPVQQLSQVPREFVYHPEEDYLDDLV